ncbi:MAG: hypothetical protein CL816_04605 [Coxiellaceae bacterium]|nr:hypothetical protein [Coxiellaceae bacterium]|tara:strand:- start:5417 stop:6247 length:831 start_codon:yes stop_codon:yes gene_type:complete
MHKGILHKMLSQHEAPVKYQLQFNDTALDMNNCIGKRIRLEYLGKIFCVQCGRKTSKSFQQGHCYVCMKKIYECNNCILHPEKCLVEEGKCREDDWAHQQCNRPHVVYLANSSALKVGVTRTSQVPTRWIDQGAMQALPLFKTSNRYQAGVIEVLFKPHVSDRTNWRTMLKQDAVPIDLFEERNRLLELVCVDIRLFLERYPSGAITSYNKSSSLSIHFPVIQYPTKILSLSLDKTPVIEGVLLGIKGQYWIMDKGVFNVRKFSGYEVHCELFSQE